MTTDKKERKVLVGSNGYFVVANTKTGTYDGFPMKEFKLQKDGSVKVTIIIDKDDFETVSDMKSRMDELRAEYEESNQESGN